MNAQEPEQSAYKWSWFRTQMAALSVRHEEEWAPLLDLIEKCDEVVGRVVSRPTSYASDRPQDFVVCVLCTRAFRLAISAINLASAGYADSVPNLNRTIMEIGIRLLSLKANPLPAALGYLLEGTAEEIAAGEAELKHRQQHRQNCGNLKENLQVMKEHFKLLGEITSQHGLDPKATRKRNGKLNIRQQCKRFGIEKSYDVDFAFASGYVHEKSCAMYDFYSDSATGRSFQLGPVPEIGIGGAFDAMKQLVLDLSFAAEVLEDSSLVQKTRRLLTDFRELYSSLLSQRHGK